MRAPEHGLSTALGEHTPLRWGELSQTHKFLVVAAIKAHSLSYNITLN